MAQRDHAVDQPVECPNDGGPILHPGVPSLRRGIVLVVAQSFHQFNELRNMKIFCILDANNVAGKRGHEQEPVERHRGRMQRLDQHGIPRARGPQGRAQRPAPADPRSRAGRQLSGGARSHREPDRRRGKPGRHDGLQPHAIHLARSRRLEVPVRCPRIRHGAAAARGRRRCGGTAGRIDCRRGRDRHSAADRGRSACPRARR